MEEVDKQICKVLTSLADALNPAPSSSANPVLQDWETYCLNYARRIAKIDSEFIRDKIRHSMEELYFNYKHADGENVLHILDPLLILLMCSMIDTGNHLSCQTCSTTTKKFLSKN